MLKLLYVSGDETSAPVALDAFCGSHHEVCAATANDSEVVSPISRRSGGTSPCASHHPFLRTAIPACPETGPAPIRNRHRQFDVGHPSHQGDKAAVEYIKRDADDYSGERMRGRGVEGQPDQ
jgi:hypothetical protein